MAQSQIPSLAIPPIAFQRPACPRCKASMMLVSIEPERSGVDLHRFQCAVCGHVLTVLGAYEDPMHSKAWPLAPRRFASAEVRHAVSDRLDLGKRGKASLPENKSLFGSVEM